MAGGVTEAQVFTVNRGLGVQPTSGVDPKAAEVISEGLKQVGGTADKFISTYFLGDSELTIDIVEKTIKGTVREIPFSVKTKIRYGDFVEPLTLEIGGKEYPNWGPKDTQAVGVLEDGDTVLLFTLDEVKNLVFYEFSEETGDVNQIFFIGSEGRIPRKLEFESGTLTVLEDRACLGGGRALVKQTYTAKSVLECVAKSKEPAPLVINLKEKGDLAPVDGEVESPVGDCLSVSGYNFTVAVNVNGRPKFSFPLRGGTLERIGFVEDSVPEGESVGFVQVSVGVERSSKTCFAFKIFPGPDGERQVGDHILLALGEEENIEKAIAKAGLLDPKLISSL